MRFTYTSAASLAGLLLLQAAGLAQAPPDSEIRVIPREQAVHVIFTNIRVGSDVRVDLAGGDHVEGRLVEKSDDELVVMSGRQRQIVNVSDVTGVRRPVPKGMTDGKAFGIGTAIGFGALFGWFLVVASGGLR